MRIINIVALGTSLIMLITEMFSGIWLAPLVAFVALAIATFVTHHGGSSDATAVVLWVVAFVAVVGWFTYLAGVGRQSQ